MNFQDVMIQVAITSINKNIVHSLWHVGHEETQRKFLHLPSVIDVLAQTHTSIPSTNHQVSLLRKKDQNFYVKEYKAKISYNFYRELYLPIIQTKNLKVYFIVDVKKQLTSMYIQLVKCGFHSCS